MRVALAAPNIAAASKRARWSKSPPDEHAFSSDGRALRGYHSLAQAALILINLARFTRALRAVYRRLGERAAIASANSHSCAAAWPDSARMCTPHAKAISLQIE